MCANNLTNWKEQQLLAIIQNYVVLWWNKKAVHIEYENSNISQIFQQVLNNSKNLERRSQ